MYVYIYIERERESTKMAFNINWSAVQLIWIMVSAPVCLGFDASKKRNKHQDWQFTFSLKYLHMWSKDFKQITTNYVRIFSIRITKKNWLLQILDTSRKSCERLMANLFVLPYCRKCSRLPVGKGGWSWMEVHKITTKAFYRALPNFQCIFNSHVWVTNSPFHFTSKLKNHPSTRSGTVDPEAAGDPLSSFDSPAKHRRLKFDWIHVLVDLERIIQMNKIWNDTKMIWNDDSR